MKGIFVTLFVIVSPIIWSQSLGTIESAEFDPSNHRFLISNQSDLVVVDENGNALSSLPIPVSYGMEVVGNRIFGITGSSIVCHDLTTGAELSSITISGAQFLNGMASDGADRIWVTDFAAKKIHEIDFSDLQNPASSIIVNNTVTTPNGICFDALGNRLVFVAWGNSAPIKAVSLTDYSVSTLLANSGVGNIDGIDNDDAGNFFIASWSPNRITQYNNDFTVSQTITVSGGLNSPADIAYAEEIDTLIIPNSGNATVRYVGFNPTVGVEEEDGAQSISLFPNPASDFIIMDWVLNNAELVNVSLLDGMGRKIENLWNGNLPLGKNKLVLDISHCPSGLYQLHISSKSHNELRELIVRR
ncbi:MAG: T9SS type A sorting domain-containing protein [Flavobacteriales bacterium]